MNTPPTVSITFEDLFLGKPLYVGSPIAVLGVAIYHTAEHKPNIGEDVFFFNEKRNDWYGGRLGQDGITVYHNDEESSLIEFPLAECSHWYAFDPPRPHRLHYRDYRSPSWVETVTRISKVVIRGAGRKLQIGPYVIVTDEAYEGGWEVSVNIDPTQSGTMAEVFVSSGLHDEQLAMLMGLSWLRKHLVLMNELTILAQRRINPMSMEEPT